MVRKISKKYTTISVFEDTKKVIDLLKVTYNHKTHDELLVEMISIYSNHKNKKDGDIDAIQEEGN